ncbi:MAG: carboxypeptidase regulatory-like domain-containing protein [Opitutaceae bacterium]
MIPAALLPKPVDFDLPAQQADGALMAFCKQARIEVLFSYDELRKATSAEVAGRMEPEEALERLLNGTGFEARPNGRGRYVVTPVAQPKGSIRGRLLTAAGAGARGIHVVISSLRTAVVTDRDGAFEFDAVAPGTYQIFAAADGLQTLQIDDVLVTANRVLTLDPFTMQKADDPSRLEPYVVEGKLARSWFLDETGAPVAPRVAIGDIDQPRTENDALDYLIFTRDQIARSGVINLNEFLRTELLQSDATTLPPDQNGLARSFVSASSNLNLGGFTPIEDATIVLVDGRRLPEIVTALPGNLTSPVAPQPDVDVIPIDLIERVEVLPVSASAIYSGSPVGGVINIVLRPDAEATELTTTYTNSLGRFDRPQSTTSLLYGESLLGGKLRLRLNATFTQVTPATEENLGYIRANLLAHPQPEDELYRATPNVSSANGSALFGPGTPSFTSVAPGADGSGGLGSLADRQGVQSLALWQPPGGGLADTPDSLDYPYGRREQGISFFGSAIYDVLPWLQVGLDATFGSTVNNTGYSVFEGNLVLPASSPFNPFGQAVNVTLNETAPGLGADYDEARVEYYSAVLGLLVKMRNSWQASLDAQYGLSVTRYRGLEGVDNGRWQQLVNEGAYNPLRDTQVYGPPQQFYDQALVFYGAEGRFVTLGDYDTFDSALRIMNPSLALPTGSASVTFGGDYRYARLGTYTNLLTYGDGSLVAPPSEWVGRSLQRLSAFGEIQAPLLPSRWLPKWVKGVETDMAARYTASDIPHEANLAPTGAVKIDFDGGFSLRATIATSNRFPPPVFSSLRNTSISPGGAGAVVTSQIDDPILQQTYNVQASDAINSNLVPEAAVTETFGAIFQRGKVHRFRVSVDLVDTATSGEESYLDAQQVVDLEDLFPQRVIRAPAAPGETVGPIISVLTGSFNTAWRRSENWNTSLDYAWTDCMKGTLEAYFRWVYYQTYRLQELPNSPPVDELRDPDGSTPGLLRQRMNFGAGWSNRRFGFGMDGHYFHSRILPEIEWASQGSDQVDPYWQFDGYLQGDLGRWLPWKSSHYSVRAQLRVDNLFDTSPPRYANDPSGAGVQSYGDWRGRVYSLSATVTF